MKKVSVYLTAAVFIAIIFGFCIWGVFLPDSEVSFAERRKLAQFPEFTSAKLMSGKWFSDLDSYVSDQFPIRDQLRTVNAVIRTDVLRQKDNNGLYLVDGYVFKSDYPTKEKNINNFVKTTNQIYEKYIKGKADSYYVSVIPDKSYFDTSDHLKTDAMDIAKKYSTAIDGAEYIDIFGGLSLDSYYKTDTHWSQDKLLPVMNIFSQAMNFETKIGNAYDVNTLTPFYGVYWGQSALNPKPDNLVYLTDACIASATVENLEGDFNGVYDLDKFGTRDSYDLFLSGATPLQTITSPNSATDKELIIFRDSFGSSIAPLFLDEYRKVTLVDLRYLSPSLLDQYVDFQNKDVLVLYSSLILNSSIIFK